MPSRDDSGRCLGYPPTTPRGPIAAMYSSPGPVYSLPVLTGYRGHTVNSMKNKGPGWILGVRHGKLVDECGPGPAYNPNPKTTRTGLDGTPHYTLHSRTNYERNSFTPGPGAYSPERSGPCAAPQAPKYSMRIRGRSRRTDQTPAANNYTLPGVLGYAVQSGKKSAPCYSMKSRSKIGGFHEDLQKTPGPGQYNVTQPQTTKQRAPAFSLAGHCAMPGDGTQKPGPGAHSPETVVINKRQAPGYCFGLRHSQFIAPLIADTHDDCDIRQDFAQQRANLATA